MELSKNSPPVNADQIAEALKILDPSLDEYKSGKLAKDILKGKDRIEISELASILGCPPDDPENSDWFVDRMLHIKKKISDLSQLKTDFEKYDAKNEGFVGIADFKMVIKHSKAGMNLNDINRFTRYIPKDPTLRIDYVKFLKSFDEVKTEDEIAQTNSNPNLLRIENLKIIRTAFENYLKENKVHPGHVIRKIYEKKNYSESIKRISTQDFAGFLWALTKNSVLNKKYCQEIANLIDIDHDGQIDDNDIQTYLNRSEDMEKAEKNLILTFDKTFKSTTGIFPQLAVDEEKVETILRDLRHSLDTKKISFYDFIKMIDTNEVGFITFQDLATGLDKVIKFSQPAKEALFSYADKMKIGMINHADFLALLKRTVIDRRVNLTEDNFDWQQGVLKEIKRWARVKNLMAEDAFRIADADFDGFISKKDLTYFVKDVLRFPADEVNDSRIDRLFKLMDIFKRGKIQLSDFKKILSDELYTSKSTIITGGKELFGKVSTDWKVHARQQIGLYLSKNFSTLEESFEEIAQHNVNLIYKHFLQWIEKDQVLSGFNITERLTQQLFADLDPHKKGYISQLDWENAFSSYNINLQISQEIQEIVYANYSDVDAAFDFFLSNEGEDNKRRKILTFNGFYQAIQSLIQNRFGKSDIELLWKNYTNNLNYLDDKKFQNHFDKKKFSGSKYFSSLKNKILPDLGSTKYSKAFSLPKKVANEIKNLSKEESQEKLFEKLRQILFTSNISVEQFFQKMDKDGSGEISNLEFINSIRSMGLGLPLKDIEELLIYCDNDKDGKISFQEFVVKFAPRETEAKLFERTKNKLKKVKENIYSYMLSPKDAFLNFNEDRTGKLTYEQFNKLMAKLAVLAREEVPSFSIIRDLFDYIDIRRDGIIDMNEWMNSFKLIENDTIMFKQQNESNVKSKRFNVQSLNKIYTRASSVSKNAIERPTSALGISNWECSKDYERVMKIIGKNRKILSNNFDDLKAQGKTITFDVVKSVIGEVLYANGFTLEENYWPYLLKFAEKEGVIDHKFLLDVFRDRFYLLSSHPKADTLAS